MRNNVVENKIREKTEFLKWYKLDDATMTAMGHTNKYPVYISPDVLSLHIIWIIDGEAEHEIADYPDSYDYTEVIDWIETEVFDDCYGPVEFDDYEDILDGQKIDEIPEINFVTEAIEK